MVPARAGRRRTQRHLLDLDVDAGQADPRFALVAGAGIHRKQAGAAVVNGEIDQGHGKQKCGLDVDPGEGFGRLGEVLTLATARGDEWTDCLAGPLGNGVWLGPPSPVRPELDLTRRPHRRETALERRIAQTLESRC